MGALSWSGPLARPRDEKGQGRALLLEASGGGVREQATFVRLARGRWLPLGAGLARCQPAATRGAGGGVGAWVEHAPRARTRSACPAAALAPGPACAHLSAGAARSPLQACLRPGARRARQRLFFLDSRLSPPTGGKKKGHVCLEKYVGQWNISCAGANGAGPWGRGGRRLAGRLLAAAPDPGPASEGPSAGSCQALTHFADRLRWPRRRRRAFLPSNRRCLPRAASPVCPPPLLTWCPLAHPRPQWPESRKGEGERQSSGPPPPPGQPGGHRDAFPVPGAQEASLPL